MIQYKNKNVGSVPLSIYYIFDFYNFTLDFITLFAMTPIFPTILALFHRFFAPDTLPILVEFVSSGIGDESSDFCISLAAIGVIGSWPFSTIFSSLFKVVVISLI